MRNRGRTISRQRLLSAVWGYSHQPNTNVVDVSMRRLRQKIGHDRVETVRSAGYRPDRMIVHRAIAWSAYGNRAEWLLATFCAVCLTGMVVLDATLAPIPFHFVYAAVTIVYGLRLWRIRGAMFAAIATGISTGAHHGLQRDRRRTSRRPS